MKVLLVGVGGVGEAIAVMAAKRPWLEKMVLADYNKDRALEVAQLGLQCNVLGLEDADLFEQLVDHFVDRADGQVGGASAVGADFAQFLQRYL